MVKSLLRLLLFVCAFTAVNRLVPGHGLLKADYDNECICSEAHVYSYLWDPMYYWDVGDVRFDGDTYIPDSEFEDEFILCFNWCDARAVAAATYLCNQPSYNYNPLNLHDGRGFVDGYVTVTFLDDDPPYGDSDWIWYSQPADCDNF